MGYRILADENLYTVSLSPDVTTTAATGVAATTTGN